MVLKFGLASVGTIEVELLVSDHDFVVLLQALMMERVSAGKRVIFQQLFGTHFALSRLIIHVRSSSINRLSTSFTKSSHLPYYYKLDF